jgi:hypothetical protein
MTVSVCGSYEIANDALQVDHVNCDVRLLVTRTAAGLLERSGRASTPRKAMFQNFPEIAPSESQAV